MDIAPRQNPKPKHPTSALQFGDAFGLVTSSDDESNSDADAEVLFTEFAGSSSESDDDDTTTDSAAGGSALSSAAHTLSSAAHDFHEISSKKDSLTQQKHRVRGKHGKLKKMSTKYRHQEASEREEALQLLGSTGAPEVDKHSRRRTLKRETKKQARAVAKQASVDKFSRPPRLSIEFAFIVLLRDRCTEAVLRAFGLSDVLISSRMGQHSDRLLEAYHHGDRALPVQLLRRTCGSGFLRHVVMQLTQSRNGSKKNERQCFRIVERVAAQLMCVARTPESDFEQGHRAWATGQCRAAIAYFERAIDGGHVRAHGALAWIRARFARPCQWEDQKFFIERTLELAKRGSTLGCRDSLAIFAHLYPTWFARTTPHETEGHRKTAPIWDSRKNDSRRVWKILKLSASAGSAYGHFFLHAFGKKSSRRPLDDELSLACTCAIESGMICGDCFLAKALCTDVFDDPDLKLATLLRAAEAGNSFAQIEVADTYSSRGMIPEAVRWYKASGAQDCDFCFCCNILLECLSKNRGHDFSINMPKDLNGVKYELGWDYCAAQLERLGYIGDAIEIYRLHRGKKARMFPGVKLQVLDQYHGVYGPYEFGYNFDLQEEFVCRNALTRLGAYDAADDEMYLLALAEDGNAIAQLEMADIYSSRGMIPEAVRWYKASGAQNYHDAPCIFDCRKYGMPKDIGEYCKYYMGWDYCAAQLERLGHVGDAYEIYRLHLGQEDQSVWGRRSSSCSLELESNYTCSDHLGQCRHAYICAHWPDDECRSFLLCYFRGDTHRRICRDKLKSLEQLGHMSLVLNAAAARPIFNPRSVRILHLQPCSQLESMLSLGSLQLASLRLWFRDNTQRAQLLGCSGALSNLAFRMVRAKGQGNSFLFLNEEDQGFMSVIVRRCLSIYAWRHHQDLDDVEDDDDDDDDGPPTRLNASHWAVF